MKKYLKYQTALERIKALQKKEKTICREDSLSQVLTHGKKQAHCYVLLHGYTNSPRQFILFSKYLYKNGSNVYIPRLPFHGLKDRMTSEVKHMTAKSLIALANESVDIALGLGEKVTVLGISAGGVTAAHIAQTRSDVWRVVLISPAFGFAAIPLWFTDVFIRISTFFPNSFMWWDPRVKEKLLPDHAYPRYSVKALGELFSIGNTVIKNLLTVQPQVSNMVFITSSFDTAIHLPTTNLVAKYWRETGKQVVEFRFPLKFKIWHDMIDPGQTYQQVARTYPIILRLLGEK